MQQADMQFFCHSGSYVLMDVSDEKALGISSPLQQLHGDYYNQLQNSITDRSTFKNKSFSHKH